ncbi:hypothetical protein [Synechocystis sp. LKSZ1]|uniref:hypothetical protein n=1 Tax=Synechocystis sp. LKSZ1 TaxID=3144951 RepID=UPI00336BC207
MTSAFAWYVIFAVTLQWLLRLFGAFWIFGGFLVFQEARQAIFIDDALEALTQEPEDRLVSRFLLLGSILTILSGACLVLASRWVFLPLSLLILSQMVYFALQRQRYQRAQTAEEREAALVSPETVNAFKVCWVVALASGLGWVMGALR